MIREEIGVSPEFQKVISKDTGALAEISSSGVRRRALIVASGSPTKETHLGEKLLLVGSPVSLLIESFPARQS